MVAFIALFGRRIPKKNTPKSLRIQLVPMDFGYVYKTNTPKYSEVRKNGE